MKTKTKTETKTKKEEPNQLEKLVLKITEPFKMDSEITFQQLTMLVGQNASGKSFMLKVAYAMGSIGQLRGMAPEPTSSAQFVFDNTFTEQNFNGLFKAVYTKGSAAVELKDGKVTKVEVEGKTEPVVYMSSDMRLFSSMSVYLLLRKAAGTDPLKFLEKMLKGYRLYDFAYVEGLLARMPIALEEKSKVYLKSMDFPGVDEIVSIDVNKDKCEFHLVLKNDKRVNIATLGNGHQAMLNMMLGATL